MAYIQFAQKVQNSVAIWPLLGVKALSKSFGRKGAIINLTFAIDEGEVVGLIGPMRSDRSTVVDLLAGTIKPTFGRITIAGEDVTQLGTDARSSLGVVCALQPAHLCLDLTVLENLLLSGAICRSPMFSRRGGKTYRDEAASVLELTGLARSIDLSAGSLSPCQQRFLTIAIALTAKPSLLLLDGPVAGMAKAERTAFGSLIADISAMGTSVLITDHDMWRLTEICDRILVLSSGRLIADDVPLGIARNPAVFSAYLSCPA
jgi:branched-chain amino acid transport system ATP-binding protein